MVCIPTKVLRTSCNSLHTYSWIFFFNSNKKETVFKIAVVLDIFNKIVCVLSIYLLVIHTCAYTYAHINCYIYKHPLISPFSHKLKKNADNFTYHQVNLLINFKMCINLLNKKLRTKVRQFDNTMF